MYLVYTSSAAHIQVIKSLFEIGISNGLNTNILYIEIPVGSARDIYQVNMHKYLYFTAYIHKMYF